ncbi:hypothetical protein EMIT093MI4_140002 [Pseudomonas sp. IT-93MI4]
MKERRSVGAAEGLTFEQSFDFVFKSKIKRSQPSAAPTGGPGS